MMSKTASHPSTTGWRSRSRRLIGTWVLAVAFLSLTAAPALAHAQKVHPPNQDNPVVSGPISQAWAQAHCNAQAPAVTGQASGGVVIFTPQEALPCPATSNPGGQVHPHAG
jgi:hypothetical protein